MKSFVIDANVLFSSLISGQDKYLEIFTTHTFFLPDFALIEIQKYQDLILTKTNLSKDKLREFTIGLFSNVVIIPNLLISTNSFYKAYQLCKDIDEKDTAYLALSIEFDLDLISKDEDLVFGLREKGYSKAITLSEFFQNIQNH